MDRRRFLAEAGRVAALGVFGGAALEALAAPVARPGRIRTITYNVLACRGYPATDANGEALKRARPQMVRRMAQELALYEPDVVTFQESPRRKTVAAIADLLGMKHAWFPGGFPGSVLTRHEILAATNCPLKSGSRPKALFTRHWGRAVLKIGGEKVTLFSAHLHPSKAGVRERELTEMLAVMKPVLDDGGPVLFQGDLNHTPTGPEYARWRDAGLVDAFAAKGSGQPLTIRSTTPRVRIDYVWCHGPLAERLRGCRVLFEGAFRTNPADPRSFALSDHIPVMADFATAG